jgi:biotin carboxyl carrier protein
VKLIVRRDGEEASVAVERRGDVYEVRLGERALTIERAVAGEGLRSLLVGGRQHEVAIVALGEGRYRVTSAAGEEEVEVLDPLTYLARRNRAEVVATRPQRVVAYMPGRVVAVLIGQGERVERGQGLVVLEAMKMQNEIVAESDGVVREIHVAPGQAVEAGDPLFDLG